MKNELSKLMRRAWAIARATGERFALCLSKAWALYRLAKRMRSGVVSFAYRKTDGTLRQASGTLQEVADTIKGTGRPDDGKTLKYYDTDANGWRSFRVENFIA